MTNEENDIFIEYTEYLFKFTQNKLKVYGKYIPGKNDEDFVQESWAKFIESVIHNRFDINGKARVKTYMCTIIGNSIIDSLKRKEIKNISYDYNNVEN